MKVNSLLYAGNNLDTAKNCWRVLLALSLSRALPFKVNCLFGHLSPLSSQVEIHKPDRQIGRNDRRPLAFGSLASACIRSFAHSGETMKLRWRSLVRRSFAHPRAVTGTAQALGRFAASLATSCAQLLRSSWCSVSYSQSGHMPPTRIVFGPSNHQAPATQC